MSEYDGGACGKYELRKAVKKLYHLRPKVSVSRVSVASRVVNPKNDELRPAVSKELDQLRPELSILRMTSCVPQLVRNWISCVPSCQA